MKQLTRIICVSILVALTDVEAAIQSGFRTNIVLATSREQVAATWSESLVRGEDGLSTTLNSSTYGWIQTERIPVGLAWRPPRTSSAVIKITGAGLAENQALSAYVRYGCDGVHWSTWIPMTHGLGALPYSQSDSLGTNTTVFTALLRIPREQQELYRNRREDWEKTDPDWVSDQDAYSRWLLDKDPFFFRDNLPFLGYVQFRLELSDARPESSCVVGSLYISGSWGVGGLGESPKSGTHPPSHDNRWNLLRDAK